MASIKIKEYDIHFPYSQPYDIQMSYMEKVIDCLHNKTHGVLESPTGTGKTLCLLAPISAWAIQKKLEKVPYSDTECCTLPNFQEDRNSMPAEDSHKWGYKKRTKVWYTSRTHSQIAQTISEIRRCNTKGLEVRVMGARDQLCINSEVLKEQDSYIKTIKCKELIKAKSCKYYQKFVHERDTRRYFQAGEVMDIEDLVILGKNCGICPYYLSKLAVETADIVLLPYNYIIESNSREANGFNLDGDIIVFDEGHNVPNTCEESYEFTFTNMELTLGVKNMKELMLNLARMSEVVQEDEEHNIAKHAEDSIFIVELLQKLEIELESLKVSEELLSVDSLFSFFERAGIDNRTGNHILQCIEDFKSDSNKLSLSGSITKTFSLLEKVVNTMFGSTIRSFDRRIINRSFKWGVRLDSAGPNNCKRVSLYCFNPSFGIRTILRLGVQSIIITSGTLSPLRTFIHELDLPNPVTIQNKHIAKSCQVPLLILGTGVNNVRMDASFTNRENREYIFSLGMTLTNLIASVPDGVLLLFSSYSMMQSLRSAWEGELGVWKRMESLKRIFVECRGKEEFIECMENFKRAIDSGNGAILMGVLRGKISEGMDFKDQYCRAVFIIGVPFPPAKDPRVKGKEKYCESLKIEDPLTKTEEKLYNSFMSVEAMRATNQAVGRVIRHGQDYGAIVLVDYRFCWPRLFQNISAWLRGKFPTEQNFSQAKKNLREFFRNVHLGKLGVQEVRHQHVDTNGCPIASYIKYEEYDQKKVARTLAPWISASVPNYNSSGKTSIEYINDDFEDISSLYRSNRSERESPEPELKKNESVFDAFRLCKNILPGFGESSVNQNSQIDKESVKRKYTQKTDPTETRDLKISRFGESSSLSSEISKAITTKKTSRFKIKPFLKGEGQEPENVIDNFDFLGSYVNHINTTSCDEVLCIKGKKIEENELKLKLVDYFKLVKKMLSGEDENQFKKHAFGYIKGEIGLSEVILLLNRLFSTKEKIQLYVGFGICIKSKDKKKWDEALKIRHMMDL